jgi:hypothetical protein
MFAKVTNPPYPFSTWLPRRDPAEYYENLLGLTFWIGEMTTLRPEVVYEHSFREKAYDANPITGAGRSRNQLTFAMDAIIHY